MIPSKFLKIHLNIILPSTSWSPQWPLSIRLSHQLRQYMCCYLAVLVREHQIHKSSWCAKGQLYYYTLIVFVDTCAYINICKWFVSFVLCLWFVMWGGGFVPLTPNNVCFVCVTLHE